MHLCSGRAVEAMEGLGPAQGWPALIGARPCLQTGPGELPSPIKGMDRLWTLPGNQVSSGLEARCTAAQRTAPCRPLAEYLKLPHQPQLCAAILTVLVRSRQVVPAPEIRPRAREPLQGVGHWLPGALAGGLRLSQCCGGAPPKNTLVLEIELIRFR